MTTPHTHARRLMPAVGWAAIGLGSAVAVAALMPAWVGYILVAVVAVWLVAVAAERIWKRVGA